MSFDFLQFARDYHVPFLESGHHHCHEGWLQTHCPFCASNSGWHLGVNLESGNCHCWRCGSLPLSQVLRSILPGIDIRELFRRYGLTKRSSETKRAITRCTTLTLPTDLGPLGPVHKRYLQRRGFDPDHLSTLWGLKGIGQGGGLWAWRIFIPIHDVRSEMMSYTARAISDERAPRYLTLENELSLENPRSLLYGEHLAGETIIVVEGPSDVWRIGPGAVATMGSSWTEEQAARIRKHRIRFIMFDNERPAQKLARALASAVASAPGETEIITGIDTDPGDLSIGEVFSLRQELGLE